MPGCVREPRNLSLAFSAARQICTRAHRAFRYARLALRACLLVKLVKYLICDLLEVGYVPGSFVRSSARGVERDRGFVWIVVEGFPSPDKIAGLTPPIVPVKHVKAPHAAE